MIWSPPHFTISDITKNFATLFEDMFLLDGRLQGIVSENWRLIFNIATLESYLATYFPYRNIFSTLVSVFNSLQKPLPQTGIHKSNEAKLLPRID